MVLGEVAISGDINLTELKEQGREVIVKRGPKYQGYLFKGTGKTTMTDITLDGGWKDPKDGDPYLQVEVQHSLVYQNGGELILGNGVILQNNHLNNESGAPMQRAGGGVTAEYCTLNIEGDAIIRNNSANFAGGVYVYDATLRMTGGEITHNIARQNRKKKSANASMWGSGGGIGTGNHMVAESSENGISPRPCYIYLSGGVISNNIADSTGGGISLGAQQLNPVPGYLIMTGGKIINNEAVSAGGGIIVFDVGLSSSLYDNYLPRNKAVIQSSVADLQNGVIRGNKVTGIKAVENKEQYIGGYAGGGVYVNGQAEKLKVDKKAGYRWYNGILQIGESTPIPEETQLLVKKHWDDKADDTMIPKAVRPKEVRVEIYRQTTEADKKKIGEQVIVVDDQADQTVVINHLPLKDENGVEYTYSVKEVPVKDYKTAEKQEAIEAEVKVKVSVVKKDINDQPLVVDEEQTKTVKGFLITNTWSPEPPKPNPGGGGDNPPHPGSGKHRNPKPSSDKTKVNVKKTWIGEAQKEVTVHLYADGTKVGEAVLNADNGWQHLFDNLPKQKDGADIRYTVEEATMPGYTASIIGSLQDGFVITNRKEDVPPTPEPTPGKKDTPEKPSKSQPNPPAPGEKPVPKTGHPANLAWIALLLGSAILLPKRKTTH